MDKHINFRFSKGSLLYIIFILLLNCSGGKVPETVENVLKKAGKNRVELEKVIKYYQELGDKEKLNAAYFLIENMEYNHSFYGERFKYFDPIFIGMDTLSKTQAHNIWDSLVNVYGPLDLKSLKQINDLQIIKAEYLINNIDTAFHAWRTKPWSQQIDFGTFCEFILPYRLQSEHLKPWRKKLLDMYKWVVDSIQEKNDIFEAYAWIYSGVADWFKVDFLRYPIAIDINNVMRAKRGECKDENNMWSWIQRANGIPIAIDYTPHWANRAANHTWHVLLDNDLNVYSFYRRSKGYTWETKTNESTSKKYYPVKGNPIDAAHYYLQEPGDKYIPPEIMVVQDKKVAKVFRYMYSLQKESLQMNKVSNETIPSIFISPKMKDVTTSYMTTSDISIHLNHVWDKTVYAYICVFDINGWTPVHWSKIVENNIVFKKMGRDICYLPVFYYNNYIVPADTPLILTNDGNIKKIRINKNKLQRIKLTRKYPLFANKVNHMNYMLNGKFQGANRSDFSDSVTLYTIKRTPYYMTEVTISNAGKYRYLRYLPRHENYSDIAELEFYSKKNGQDYILQGNPIGIEGDVNYEIKKAFDNNWDSFYGFEVKGGWIGLDLGKGNSYRITKIRYCPKNDTNIILPGNIYELLFWDNSWKSLGKKEATNYYLVYDNAPSNTLFWLHCHSGGKEERIFTYEDGKQVWW